MMGSPPNPKNIFRITLLLSTVFVPVLAPASVSAQPSSPNDAVPSTHKRLHRQPHHKREKAEADRVNKAAEAALVGKGSLVGVGVPVLAGPKGNPHLTYVPPEYVTVHADVSHIPNATGTLQQARLAQKMAPNIIETVSQAEIKKIPDFVLGDAARRLPGASVIDKSGEARSIQIRGMDPNLNGVSFEGVLLPAGSINSAGRAVPLDAIPAPLAGGLELIKTNLPNQDATALGGQLNILSRDIQPYDKPYLEVITAAGFRDPHPTNIFQGTISGGTRFGFQGNPFDSHNGHDKPFSISFFASALTDWLQMDDLQQTFLNKAGYPANALSKATQVLYAGHKVRWGYGGTLGWDVDRHTNLYLKMFDSGLEAPVVKNQLSYAFATPYSFNAGQPGIYTAKTGLSQTVNDTWVHTEEKVYKFGGASEVGSIKLDYFGAYASSFVYSPYSYTGTFSDTNTTVPISVDNVSNPLLPTMASTNRTNIIDYSKYKLSALSNAAQNDTDTEWSGHVGATMPLDFLMLHGSLSAGGGLRLEHVLHNDPTFTYGNLPGVNAGSWAGNNNYTIYNDAYSIGNPVGTQHLRQLVDDHTYPITQNVAKDAITTRQASVNDNENVYNGYADYQASWGRLGFIAGVRYEKTDGVYRGTSQSQLADGTTTLTPRAVGQEYANFFPTVQLRYALAKDLIARANWSTAIGRPGFSQVTASQTISYSAATVTTGNPNLKATTGNNFDLSLEYYLPEGGIASFGAFDKEFKNYIVSSSQYGSYPGIPIAQFSTYANIPYGYARGFEGNYHQQFTFLPGFWKGFGVGGNFTFVSSRGAGRSGDVETLPNTASHIYNMEAFYSRGPVSIQFDGNYQGLTMTSLGLTPNLDSYVQPFLNFDIGARYALTKRATIYFQGRNITQEKQNATQGSGFRNFIELQYFGSSYLFGMDFTL